MWDPKIIEADKAVLRNILDTQGAGFVLNLIAEYLGDAWDRFGLPNDDRQTAVESYVDEFTEALRDQYAPD